MPAAGAGGYHMRSEVKKISWRMKLVQNPQ